MISVDLMCFVKWLKVLCFCVLGQFFNDRLFFVMIIFGVVQPLWHKG